MKAHPRSKRLANRAIRTFLADDSPFMLALVARILRKDERIFLVGSATDGRKVVHSASTLDLDLVVLDLHMPGVNGVEATRLLKGRLNPPTIFIVSSDDSLQARTKCIAFGADAFISKSMHLEAELHTALNNSFPGHLTQEKARATDRRREAFFRACSHPPVLAIEM